jgi:hypothetical protein
MAEKLGAYKKKRDFEQTPEPAGSDASGDGLRFVIQQHDATNLHWDLRLERDGVLASWALPRGIPGHPDEVPPVRVSVEAARTMDKRGGWGVFARVYTGQDDYNLGFLTRITVLQLGATISQERMPSFHQ